MTSSHRVVLQQWYPNNKQTNTRTNKLEVLLPELELHILARRRMGSLANLARRRIRPAEVHPDLGLEPMQARHIRLVLETVAHSREEAAPIGPSEVRAALQLRQRIKVLPDGVEVDIRGGIVIQPLREIRVDPQELRAALAGRRRRRLRLQRRQQRLEPLERGGVLADPDELDTAQPARRVGPRAQVPDVLEDGRPRRHADACADQHRDLVLEHVLRRRSVRPVHPQRRHLLPVLQRHLVHAHWVQALEVARLRRPAAQRVAERARKVAYLPDVDAHIWIEGARGDGEWVPLVAGDLGDLDEEPLSGFVVHAVFAELDFHGIWRSQCGS